MPNEFDRDDLDKKDSGPEHGRKGTDEPWKRPGQSSQDPAQKPPPRREPESGDNKTQ